MPLDNSAYDMGQVLRKAQYPHQSWEAKSESAKGLVENLCQETELFELENKRRKRTRRGASIESLRETVAALIACLLRHSLHGESLGFLYLPGGTKTLKGTKISDRPFRDIKKIWPQMGLMEIRKGFKQTDDFEGAKVLQRRWAHRYRALPRLIELAKSSGITSETIEEHFFTQERLFEPLRLKARSTQDAKGGKKQGKPMQFEPCATSRRIIKAMNDYNNFLNSQTFEGVPHPQYQRIFNNGDDPWFDWNMGGRLYAVGPGSVTSMKSEMRRNIRINGKDTVELDIQASHITIAHGLLQEPFDVSDDPYDVPGLDRSLAKKATVMMIGAGEPIKQWPRGFKKAFEEETGKPLNVSGRRACELILNRHPILGQLSEKGLDWAKLQYHEAEALFSAVDALWQMTNIPSLPIHDSLIVPASKQEQAVDTMKLAFKAKCGITPKITTK